ncbi:uncharacterized protein [Miscanthus floridulus]|uniref:uncharacterized protein n=1 Tax=Miscanthus floridulus TaxID=154761 RepID=UPI00345AC0EB
MKDSSYHSAKIAAYCREVRQLEDKFNGLKLNHILRRLNEAAAALAKAASSQEPVPMGVFASDQHKPSVCYEESEQASGGTPALGSGANQPLASSDPEVIELDKDPATEPDPLANWRTPYLDYVLHDVQPMGKTEARRLVHRTKSFVLIEGELYKRSHTRIL